jgi:hypothetical protein
LAVTILAGLKEPLEVLLEYFFRPPQPARDAFPGMTLEKLHAHHRVVKDGIRARL